MATLKLTIDGKRTYADGRVPIIYRLTHHTQTTRIESGIKVLINEWDSVKCRINKTHPKSKELNILLSKKLLDHEKRLLELVYAEEYPSINELKKALLKEDKISITNFLEFANIEIQDLRDKEKFGNAQIYETAVNRLISYTVKI